MVSIDRPLLAQRPTSSEEALRQWADGCLDWLRGQVTPNRAVPEPDPTRRRLLVSYEIPPASFPSGFHRSATYDDALGALAFLVAGERDRAAFTPHALARLVRADGSLWAGYNTANDWPHETDHEAALVRAGAVGWAGYAFTFYLAHDPPCGADQGCERERSFFLGTATRLGSYLVSLQVNDPNAPRDGLLRLGFGSVTLRYRPDINNVVEIYEAKPALAISTENNISIWFFLRQLASLTGEARWGRAADRIRDALVRSTWNEATGQFDEGFDAVGALDRSKALDCASWGALFLLADRETQKARRGLEAIEAYYATKDGKTLGYRPYFDQPIFGDPEVGKFFFPDNPRREWRDLPLVWSEGSLGVALAYLRMGQADRARRIVTGLSTLQAKGSGLRCASMGVPYQMRDVRCAAASSWLVFLEEALRGNPLAEQIWK